MHKPDWDRFTAVLDELRVNFGVPKGSETPEQWSLLVNSYWNALRDQTLEAVTGMAKNHQRYGKYFPKPFELRPKETKAPSSVHEDPSLQAALRLNLATWRAAFARDHVKAMAEFSKARAARLMAEQPQLTRNQIDILAETQARNFFDAWKADRPGAALAAQQPLHVVDTDDAFA